MARASSINDILKDLDAVLEKTAADNTVSDSGLKEKVMSPNSTQGAGSPAQDAAEVALRKGHKITRESNPETSHLHREEGNVGEKVQQENTATGPQATKSSAEEAAEMLLQKIQALLSKNAAEASETTEVVAATPQGKAATAMDKQIDNKEKESEAGKTVTAAATDEKDQTIYELSKKAGELVAENMILQLLAQSAQQQSTEKQASAYVAQQEKQAAEALMAKQAQTEFAQGAAYAEQLLKQAGAAYAEQAVAAVIQKQAQEKQAEAAKQTAEDQLTKLAALVAEAIQKKNQGK